MRKTVAGLGVVGLALAGCASPGAASKAEPPLDPRVARASVRCAVEIDGVLTDCKVLSQYPAWGHFGAAALAMTKRMRAKPPPMRDGRPISETITIPFAFKLAPANTASPSPAPNPASN